MVPRWSILAVALLFFMVQVSSDAENEAHQTQVLRGSNRRLLEPNLDCDGLCKTRCGLHSRPKICTRACGTCCMRCNCVPPGTSGNRELCGMCYTDMTTQGTERNALKTKSYQ